MQREFRVQPRDLTVFLEGFRGSGLEIEKKLVDGVWHVTVTAPEGPSAADIEDPTPVEPPAPVVVVPAAPPVPAPPSTGGDDTEIVRPAPPEDTRQLGVLSARFESGSRSTAAIGHDSTGGFSWGKYQIATLTGTFARFMQFLETEFPVLHAQFTAAGGTDAAMAGTQVFKDKWRELAKTDALQEAEHGFIKATHYDLFVQKLNGIGLHVDRRSFALKNVIWSIAVQHGPGNSVVKNALDPLPDPATLSDKELITAIYKERSNVNKYFSRSTSAVKKSVKNRFKQEKEDALVMLKAEQG